VKHMKFHVFGILEDNELYTFSKATILAKLICVWCSWGGEEHLQHDTLHYLFQHVLMVVNDWK
jgi:hypothetical protein